MNPSSAAPSLLPPCRPSRWLAVLALLLVATLLLAGCGNKGDLVLPPPPAEASAAP